MANAYSPLHNYDQPVYTPDFNFIGNALQAKQQAYNVNKAQIQSVFDDFSMLSVAKDVDQEYIAGRLQKVKAIADKYNMVDLSDNSFKDSMIGNIAQVFDGKVKSAVISTKRMQAEDAEWEKNRVDDPDKYSEKNRQYALQRSDRLRYLSSEDAGDSYGGGANFIEYRDLSEKWMEAVPELQKMLKAEWVSTGPQEGYFKPLNSYEEISPAAMRNALGKIFDDKDYKQMDINAWGSYDKMPVEQLKEEYNSHFLTGTDDEEKAVEALEQLRDQSSGDKRRKYVAEIEARKARLQSYKSNDFNKIYGTYGKEAAYSTLYRDKYLSDLTTAFSYDKRLVDREIDEVQEENVKFEQKVKEFEHKVEMDNKNFELKKLQAEAKLLGSKGKSNRRGVNGNEGVIYGDDVEITPEDTKSETDYALQQMSEAFMDFKDLQITGVDGVETTLGNISANEMIEIGKEVKKMNLASGGVYEITKRGKTYKVDTSNPDVVKTLQNFKDYALFDSPEVKQAMDLVQNTMDAVEENLVEVSVYNDYEALQGLPPMTASFVTKNGKTTIVRGATTESYQHVNELLRNKRRGEELTKDEQLTISLYSNYMLAIDPEIDEATRKLVFKKNRQMLVDAVGSKEANKLPVNLKELETLYGATPEARSYRGSTNKEWEDVFDELNSNITEERRGVLEKKKLALERRLTRMVDKNVTINPGKGQNFLSDINYYDVGTEKNFETLIENSNTTLQENLKEVFERAGVKPVANEVLVSSDNNSYQSLRNLGSSKATTALVKNAPIALEPLFDEKGDSKDEWKVIYKTDEKGTAEGTFDEIKVTTKELREIYGLDVGSSTRNKYDARLPYAPTVELGSMKDLHKTKENFVYNYLPSFDADVLEQSYAQAFQLGDEVADNFDKKRKSYTEGEYEFKLVPNGFTKTYDAVMVDQDGNELAREQDIGNNYSDAAAANLITGTEMLFIKDKLFTQHIQVWMQGVRLEKSKEIAKKKIGNLDAVVNQVLTNK